jgi:hypothetical protein
MAACVVSVSPHTRQTRLADDEMVRKELLGSVDDANVRLLDAKEDANVRLLDAEEDADDDAPGNGLLGRWDG